MHTARPYITLTFLMTLLLLCFIGLSLLAAESFLYLYCIILMGSIIFMNLFSFAKNFIYTLILILLLGFLLLFIALYYDLSLKSQLFFIFQHSLLTASLLLIWMVFNQIEKCQDEIIALKEKVQNLEKYKGSSKLLTPAEFSSRVSLISTATRRRGEENCYVRFTINHDGDAKKSMKHLLVESLFNTVRSEFDLVTELEDGSCLVFLQNTKEDTCHLVAERLFEKLRGQLKWMDIPVDYVITNEKECVDLKNWLLVKESGLA